MSDPTITQVNNRLERLEEIVHANAIGMQEIQHAILNMTQLQDRSNRRHHQHDLELDDHDERTERLEKILESQETKIEELKEIQSDVKSMLAILLGRSIGES